MPRAQDTGPDGSGAGRVVCELDGEGLQFTTNTTMQP